MLGTSARAAGQVYNYKLGIALAPTHPTAANLAAAAAEIARASNGRLNIQVFPNSQLGGDNDLLSQVRTGAIEFCQPAGLILASLLPVTAINGMGFAFHSYDKVWKAMDGELGEYVRGHITEQVGLVPMERIWDLGFRQITNSIRPINSARTSPASSSACPARPRWSRCSRRSAPIRSACSSATSIPRCRPRWSTARKTRCRSSTPASSTRSRSTARMTTTCGTATG